MKPFIAYYRVSTEKQGQSGLGLDAQQSTVKSFVGEATILAEYVEVESGANNSRSELDAAMGHARLSGATLVIARLDRLSRNVAFVAALMDSGVEFVCCDNPHANRFTIHILAAMAEHERELISQRTKAALAAAKRRGVRLGGRRHDLTRYSSAGGRQSAISRQAAADQYARRLCEAMRRLPGLSGEDLVEALRSQGFTSPTGRLLTQRQIDRALSRAA